MSSLSHQIVASALHKHFIWYPETVVCEVCILKSGRSWELEQDPSPPSPLPLSKKRRQKSSSRSKKFSPTPPPYPLFYSRPFPSMKPEAAIVPGLYLGWT